MGYRMEFSHFAYSIRGVERGVGGGDWDKIVQRAPDLSLGASVNVTSVLNIPRSVGTIHLLCNIHSHI